MEPHVSVRSRKQEIWEEYQKARQQLQSATQLSVILEQRVKDLDGELSRLNSRTAFSVDRQRRLTAENERLVLLLGLTLDLMGLSPERVLSTAVKKIPYILRAKTMSVYLYESKQKTLVLKDTNHDREIDPVIDLATRSSSLMALAVNTRQTLIVSDIAHYQSNQSELDVRFPYREQYGTPSCMVSPLIFGDQVLGVINLADRLDGEAFDRADREALTHVARFISVALANARKVDKLKEAAAIDALTSLPGQKNFVAQFEAEHQQCETLGEPICLAVFNVVSLSFINGNYGPNVGDMVLEQLASLAKQTIGTGALLGRLAGDLFAVAFSKTRLNEAMQQCRELQQAVSKHAFQSDAEELQINIILGLVQASRQKRALELIRDAESALAEAKNRDQSIGVKT